MSGHSGVLKRVRTANPIPGIDHVDPAEYAAIRALVDEKLPGPSTPAALPGRRDRTQPLRRSGVVRPETAGPRTGVLRPAAAFVASLVLVIVSVGILALLSRSGERPADEPIVPLTTSDTAPPATTPPPASTAEPTTTQSAPTSPPRSTVVPEPPPPLAVELLEWTRLSRSAVFGDGTSGTVISDLAYGHNTWVLVGHDQTIYTEHAEGTHGLPGGTYEGKAAVWTSPDGLAWTRITGQVDLEGEILGAEDDMAMSAVTATNDGFVAVGWTNGPGDDARGPGLVAAAWISPDGASWTRVAHDPAVFGEGHYGARMIDVIVVDDRVVAVGELGNGAAVWISDDAGATWRILQGLDDVFGHRETERETHDGVGDGRQRMNSIVWGAAGFVAVGSYGEPAAVVRGDEVAAVWRSPDGLTWERVSHDETVFGGEGRQWMNDIAVTESGLVAFGTDEISIEPSGFDAQRVAAWYSPDGVTWTRVAHDPAIFGEFREGERTWALRVTGGSSGIVAVGQSTVGNATSAAVWTSHDGISWERVAEVAAFAEAWMRAVAATTEGFIAVGGASGEADPGYLYGGNAAVWITQRATE